MDTTLRDGEQTQGVSFSPAEKVSVAKALLESLRVDRVEVASACVSDGEQEAVRNINEWAQAEGFGDAVEVLGFSDHKRSVDWIVAANGRVINLLTKGSEKHCREQLGKTLEEHVEQVLNTVNYALEQGLKVNVYLEDWSNGYANSPEYVFAYMDAIKDARIDHFMLPDTLGVMSPDEVFDALSDMCTRYPNTQFDFHPHNDYGLGTANIMAAVRAGVSAIHCTVNCLGERAGNASVSEVTVVLRDKMGMELSIDESNIVRLSNMVENFSGKWVAANAPIIGDDVFTQTAGIHADGDKKGGLYESKLRPERFSRIRSYALGKMSGKASLSNNLERLGITLSEENQKRVLERIVRLSDSKQTITAEDLPFIIADVLESESYKHIKLLDCSITSRLDASSVATIKVNVKGNEHESIGNGNGGFDAFIKAVNKVLLEYDVELPALADYEVRIPKGGHTSALTECVITWEDPFKKRKTRGVHSNQVFASISAALRMINIQLHEKK